MMTSETLKRNAHIISLSIAACGMSCIEITRNAIRAEEEFYRITNQPISKEEYDKAMAELTRRSR